MENLINSVKMKNFKAFKDLELSNLSRINLIGGQNNIGKTSILEALFLFYDRKNAGSLLRHQTWRGISNLRVDPESLWGPVFRRYNLKEKIIINIARESVKEAMEIEYKDIKSQSSIQLKLPLDSDNSQVTNDLEATSALEIIYKINQEVAIKAKQTTEGQGLTLKLDIIIPPEHEINAVKLSARGMVSPNEDANRFGLLDIEGKTDTVLEFLKIIEPRLKNLSSVAMSDNSLLHGEIKGLKRKIPIAAMGDGMSRLLSIILAIGITKDGIVLIDEIENGIHHSVMAKVWEGLCKAAVEFNTQIFATTHSYEFLQAALEGAYKADIQDKFRYLRLSRDGDDNIFAKTYSYNSLAAAIETGWEVR